MPRVGIEPTTPASSGLRSTNELPRQRYDHHARLGIRTPDLLGVNETL